MEVTIKSRFELSDKVEFVQDKSHVNWYKGVIVGLKWDEKERQFVYLVEKENKERVWAYEQNVIPHEKEENK